MAWNVTRRFSSAMDEGPDVDEYLTTDCRWAKEKSAAHPFHTEADAWVACRLAGKAHVPDRGPVPNFGVHRTEDDQYH